LCLGFVVGGKKKSGGTTDEAPGKDAGRWNEMQERSDAPSVVITGGGVEMQTPEESTATHETDAEQETAV